MTPATHNLFSEGDFALQLQAQRNKLQEIDETEAAESRPADSRSELMDNIKSQNFKLRRLSINPFDRKAIVARPKRAWTRQPPRSWRKRSNDASPWRETATTRTCLTTTTTGSGYLRRQRALLQGAEPSNEGVKRHSYWRCLIILR